MFDHVARTRGLASLGPILLVMAVVGACSVPVGAATKPAAGPGSGTVQNPDTSWGGRQNPAAGGKAAINPPFVSYANRMPAAQPKRATAHVGMTGTHPGGGGPQE